MSRIGKSPIILDPKIKIQLKHNYINIEGPKGKLEHHIHDYIKVEQKADKLIIQTVNDSKTAKELHGLSRTIINNMIKGVSEGFSKILDIQGVGYRAQLSNKNDLIIHVGYSHPVNIIVPKNITIKIENNNRIVVQGIDKTIVGEIAAQIRSIRPPEPYKGKGIRYHDEIIKKKIGKAGK